jgi:hypothetical protein
LDIGAWLRDLGLERYEQAFQDTEVEARSLPHLTADDLKKMGVTAIGRAPPSSSDRGTPGKWNSRGRTSLGTDQLERRRW